MSEWLYIVRDWGDHFEIAESLARKSLRWLATPTKHDGIGYRRMMAQRDGPALFGAWNAIIQTAAKAGKKGVRGRLERDGNPLDAESIALMTSFPVHVIERALTFFSDPKQGWLDKLPVGTGDTLPGSATAVTSPTVRAPDAPPPPPTPTGPQNPDQSARHPDVILAAPATGQTEQDRQTPQHARGEGGGWFALMVENEASRTLGPTLNTAAFRDAWRRWVRHLFGRKGNGRRPSLETLESHIAQLEPMGATAAITAIDHAIAMDWSRPELPNTNGKGEHHARNNQRTAGAIRGPSQSEAKLA